LKRTGFRADSLTLEVTESQAVTETSTNDRNLHGLRASGLGISVDDFGTGYSSLAQLHTLPVTEVKLDRSFTTRLGDEESNAFVAGIVGLGHGLGLRVVAEGVETQSQFEALRAMGCERAQGYLLGKPVEASALERRLGVPWQAICPTELFSPKRETQKELCMGSGTRTPKSVPAGT
jgi:EAL domain-containing protein (putative c-di-GMP-specific phosphodiesterase class I)